MKKKKFELKSFLLILTVGLVVLACFLPQYIWTVERAKAGSAETVLLGYILAEYRYFEKNQHYSYDWAELDRLVAPEIKRQGVLAPAPEIGEERFLGFSTRAANAGENGFSLGIELGKEKTEGKIYAVRAGGLMEYTLTETFPQGVYSCEAEGYFSKKFCTKFSAYMAPFLLREEPPQGQGADAAESR